MGTISINPPAEINITVRGVGATGAPGTTVLAECTQDEDHRTVSDAEKAEWNGAVADVAAETTRATNVETTILANLESEINRAKSVETTKADVTELEAEVERAKSAEEVLTEGLSAIMPEIESAKKTAVEAKNTAVESAEKASACVDTANDFAEQASESAYKAQECADEVQALFDTVDSWEKVQTIVRNGWARRKFAVGDILECEKDGTVIKWQVMDFIDDNKSGALKIKDNTRKYGMVLQSQDILYNLQYDNREAFYYCETALTAGTYNFTIAATWAKATAGTYQFTTTKDLPAGAQLVFGNAICDNDPSAWTVQTFADSTTTTATETGLTVTSGSSGTSLGTINVAVTGNLNSIHRDAYGSNRYGTSAMRQHLNSAKAAGSVWTPQTKFDRPPSWVSSTAGFMKGLDPAFISIVADLEVDTCLSPISGDCTSTEASSGTGYETTEDKFFLAGRSEIYGGAENASDKGTAWEFYSANSDLSAAGGGDDKNRIKYNSSGTAYYWWERTPDVGYAGYVRGCHPSGYATNSHYAYSSTGVVPACVVA